MTASTFSSSAREVLTGCTRSVGEAKRDTLCRWVKAVRTPGIDVFRGKQPMRGYTIQHRG